VVQIEPSVRLVQEVYPGAKRYNLYFELLSENAPTVRTKLIRLQRFYPSFHCWVGHNTAGDYVIVLKHLVLGVRKTGDSDKI
jgi:hypothetical protein